MPVDEDSMVHQFTLASTAYTSGDKKRRNNKQQYDRQLSGKKGSTIGKQRDKDCADVFTVLSGPCPIIIDESGRYVLEENLICGLDNDGININVNDVLPDCKNKEIE